ncbi:myb-like protein AA [Musca domestica]|uniref:Myb-like protein AA n=1 Tax=Musca domestica TaxID=7370 RepID=A0ABM3V6X0_MUSDO|nr:myb-like protein AA [Musca domestica]
MPILLLNTPTYSTNITQNVMLLEYNNCLIKNRLLAINHHQHANPVAAEQQIETCQSTKMSTPSATGAKYKTTTATTAAVATTATTPETNEITRSALEAANMYLQQQQQQQFQRQQLHHQQQQQQQHQHQQQQHLLMQQHMLQQNLLSAANSTSPLQHLNNIFGLNFNPALQNSPSQLATVPSPAATMPLAASSIFHIQNNLQHLLAGIAPQQQQQFNQLYQEFYGNMLPQHYHEQQMLRELIAATSTAQTDILPVNSMIKCETPMATTTTNTLSQDTAPPPTLLATRVAGGVTNMLLDDEVVEDNLPGGGGNTPKTGGDNDAHGGDIDGGAIGGIAPNHNDCSSGIGNMASLEQQHNETTHANQHQHHNQPHSHHQPTSQYQLSQPPHKQYQQQLGNNKLPKAQSATSHQTTRVPTTTPITTTATTNREPQPSTSGLALANNQPPDLSEADIKSDVAGGGGGGVEVTRSDIGRGNASSVTLQTPVNNTATLTATTTSGTTTTTSNVGKLGFEASDGLEKCFKTHLMPYKNN